MALFSGPIEARGGPPGPKLLLLFVHLVLRLFQVLLLVAKLVGRAKMRLFPGRPPLGFHEDPVDVGVQHSTSIPIIIIQICYAQC